MLRAEADTKAAQRRLAEAQRQRDQSESRLRVDLALDQPIRVGPPGAVFPSCRPRPPCSSRRSAGARRWRRPTWRSRTPGWRSASSAAVYFRSSPRAAPTSPSAPPFRPTADGQFSLNFNVPIFDSGEVKARVAVAREQELQAELQLAETRQGVREDVRRALVDLNAAEASLVLARDQLTASDAEYAQAWTSTGPRRRPPSTSPLPRPRSPMPAAPSPPAPPTVTSPSSASGRRRACSRRLFSRRVQNEAPYPVVGSRLRPAPRRIGLAGCGACRPLWLPRPRPVRPIPPIPPIPPMSRPCPPT